MPLVVLLLSLFASPVFAQEAAPAPMAYETQLRTRLMALGQQEYALRYDDDARRCRRWKVMGLVFGGAASAGALVGMMYWNIRSAHVDVDPVSTRERITVGSVVGTLGAAALTGFGFAIASRVTNPHRDALHQVRREQIQLRKELRRRANERAWQLSLDGFGLRF